MRRGADRAVPLSGIGLLRTDMKRYAIGVETALAGLAQQSDRHFRGAAELARERPLGTLASYQDAAEDARSGSGARQLVELVLAVESEKSQPGLIGKGDVLFLFDRIAEGQPVGGDAVSQAQLDLAAARHVEIGALCFEHGDDLRRRVRLHRIKDPGQRQVPAQRVVGPADRVEIDDEARGFGGIFGEETRNPLIHQSGHPSRRRLGDTGSVSGDRGTAACGGSFARAGQRPTERDPKTKSGPGPDRQFSAA